MRTYAILSLETLFTFVPLRFTFIYPYIYIRGYSVSGCAIYLFRLRCQVGDDDDENQWPTYAPQNNNGSEKQLQLVMSSREGKGEQ